MTKPKKPYEATRPERIPEKVDECNFFLDMMDAYKERKPIREFLWYLSAFLCAHRSLSYRLFGVVRHRKGSDDAQALWKTLHSDGDIDWLGRLRDLEVHGDGVTVWACPPFANPLEPVGLYPTNLTERCRTALRKMENIIRDAALLMLAVMLSLSGPGLLAQTPRPPKPKPVEDVPAPDIGQGTAPVVAPASSLHESATSPQASTARTWAMFLDEPWPSEQALTSLARACRGAYGLGPNAQETIMLEKTVQDLKKVLAAKFHLQRTIVVVPVYSPEINAWNTNGEDVLYSRGELPTGRRAENTSLICVPQGIIDFFFDAPEELEAVIAHEIGHAIDIPCYQDVRPRTALPQLVQQGCESRADAFALNAFIAQGKNPYAVAGAFGRLNMYIGDTSTGLFARLKNFASDHPLTPDRIRNLRSILLEAQRTHQLQPLPAIIR